jgi:hypothetical protein
MKSKKLIAYIDILLIVAFAAVPLFSTFPYRVNIFLSWEGAYRMSEGQVPFQDFGLPMGYMFWVVPSWFFKMFGPSLLSLVKAQVFINILSGLAFRSILRSLNVQEGLRIAGVLVYCLSYSFFNFWPWYNHTVIVYEFVSIALLLKGITSTHSRWQIVYMLLGGTFLFITFFTKQDGGGLAILISGVLVGYASLADKKWWYLPTTFAGFGLAAAAILLPLRNTQLSYWFNHGQPPHNSRLSLFDIVDEFFTNSQWIKFYLFIILLLLIPQLLQLKTFAKQKNAALFTLLTLGILAEAAIFQITSYTPPDNNIFFHSFAIVFILHLLSQRIAGLDFSSFKVFSIAVVGLMLWWSGTYWKYFNRILSRTKQNTEVSKTEAVGRKSYMINNDTTDVPMSKWVFSNRKGFEKIYMPPSTKDGIERVMDLPEVKNSALPRKILNLTELTPLILELQYTQDKGPGIPLWHHRGVAMFDKEVAFYTDKIHHKQYDLVLFEYMPTLNNFFPFEIRDSLLTNYQKIDSFHAPRRPTDTWIEVFVKPRVSPLQ